MGKGGSASLLCMTPLRQGLLMNLKLAICLSTSTGAQVGITMPSFYMAVGIN